VRVFLNRWVGLEAASP